MLLKILKFAGMLLLAAVVLALCFVGYLTVTEFKPEKVEQVDVSSPKNAVLSLAERNIRIMTVNTGYAALGAASDFFMDGGSAVRPEEKEVVEENLQGLKELILNADADAYLLQEVDLDSKRSYYVDELAYYRDGVAYSSSMALNYSCRYVPYPVPAIGKVNSGLATLCRFEVESAERISLPSPFSWPVRTANLKRCLLVSYIPVEGTDRYLVLVNLHLEAYDDGGGKLEQTRALKAFLEAEYAKGNYVIAGGDFNQAFPGTLAAYPVKDAKLWAPGVLEEEMLPEGWTFAYDDTTPTCRLLNQPYDAESEKTQYYVIDGFILSPGVDLVSVETLDEGFVFTDHNPVLLEAVLQ